LAIAHAVKRGAKVELILTDKILDILFKEHYDLLKEVENTGRLGLFKIDRDVRVAFTVTDKLISLGLFGQDGVEKASGTAETIIFHGLKATGSDKFR